MNKYRHIKSLAVAGESGRHWYAKARADIAVASNILAVPTDRLTGLLAVFSPRVSVKRSIRFALRYAATGQFLPDCMRSTRAAVHHYEATGKIRGPKTSAFAAALQGDAAAVVLDVWMARAFDVHPRDWSKATVRTDAEEYVVDVAEALHWTPAETQAAVWTATIRRHRRTPVSLSLTCCTLWGTVLVG